MYTQHYPAFARVIERLARGRLPSEDYPFASADGRTGVGGFGGSTGSTSDQVPATGAIIAAHQRGCKLIIAFIIGGTTYEEAKAVSEMNMEGQANVYLVRVRNLRESD